MGFEIRQYRTQKELEAARKIILKVIAGDSIPAYRRVSRLFALTAKHPKSDVIVVKLGSKVIGALQIVEKKLKIFNRTILADGITNVCIDNQFQGRGLGRKLMEFTLEVIRKRGKAFSILVARKRVDNFYKNFGYVGTGCFSDMILNSESFINAAKLNDFTYKPKFMKSKINIYKKAYTKTYQNIPFSFFRDRERWNNARAWMDFKNLPFNFINVLYKNNLIGYFINHENEIIEAASLENDVFCQALLFFAKQKKMSELVIKCSQFHPCCQYLYGYNHTFTLRRAWNGGHMIRIVNSRKLLAIINNYIIYKHKNGIKKEMLSKAIQFFKNILSGVDAGDSVVLYKLLIKIIHCNNNLIVSDIGRLFQHTWGRFDEF